MSKSYEMIANGKKRRVCNLRLGRGINQFFLKLVKYEVRGRKKFQNLRVTLKYKIK